MLRFFKKRAVEPIGNTRKSKRDFVNTILQILAVKAGLICLLGAATAWLDLNFAGAIIMLAIAVGLLVAADGIGGKQ